MKRSTDPLICQWIGLGLVTLALAGCDLQGSGSSQPDDLHSLSEVVAIEQAGRAPSDEQEEGAATPPKSPSAQSKVSKKSPDGLPAHPFPRRRPAPALDGGIAWLNTSAPLELRELRGKFVLLDFWTYCCINCIHVLPELKKLEEAYPNQLVVIGVHSAKFEKERDSQNIREAIQRYEIKHPVVNDAKMTIWDRYGIRSWPSMVLIDPEGNDVGHASGEMTFEELSAILDAAIPYYKRKNTLVEKPIKFDLEVDKLQKTTLRFPGKVLADGPGGRLFITDSNHNRLVVTDLQGKLLYTIGSGKIGKADGGFDTCSFDHPQGVALSGETLYIADTENHLLRKVDLTKRQVETIAGVGKQRRGPWPGMRGNLSGASRLDKGKSGEDAARKMRFSGEPLATALNSPWALWVHGDSLFIAMAGQHQIWEMTLTDEPGKQEIGIYAGNGREDILDGELLPPYPYVEGYAAFAQPSGLASDGEFLYVADSEGASIRKTPLPLLGKKGDQDQSPANANDRKRVLTRNRVSTVVGTSNLPGGRLFVFGDRDGKGLLSFDGSPYLFRGEADQVEGPLLQHPLGVAYDDGTLYVADTYNDKIKTIDLATGETRSIQFATSDGTKAIELDEPTGLSVSDGKLYIADTNNHRVCVVDLRKSNSIRVLEIEGLESVSK